MLKSLAIAFSLMLGLALSTNTYAQDTPVRVVYHLTDGVEQAQRAMNNISNHLAADPTAKIIVVGNGKGIDFMLKEAKDSNGALFSNKIEELSLRGVQFHLCNNTLETRKISKDKAIEIATIVPAGVVDVTNLQFKEHYAYLKP